MEGEEMKLKQIINFEQVELMKVTGDTTVFARFTSGEGVIYEFRNQTDVDDMTRAFIDWCDGGSHRKAYTILKEREK
jgi:hypothetical protein